MFPSNQQEDCEQQKEVAVIEVAAELDPSLPRVIILDLSPVNFLDTVGVKTLRNVRQPHATAQTQKEMLLLIIKEELVPTRLQQNITCKGAQLILDFADTRFSERRLPAVKQIGRFSTHVAVGVDLFITELTETQPEISCEIQLVDILACFVVTLMQNLHLLSQYEFAYLLKNQRSFGFKQGLAGGP